jgi:hypothetical protein
MAAPPVRGHKVWTTNREWIERNHGQMEVGLRKQIANTSFAKQNEAGKDYSKIIIFPCEGVLCLHAAIEKC